MSDRYDFLIAGSGFGGCLLGLILKRLGFAVAIVDRAAHPRFAIGESSTPLADATLRDLCQRYALTEIAPLTAYGTVKRQLPQLTVGLKRGFTYFRQRRNHRFSSTDNRLEQLIVAASLTDDTSDTHWMRSDIDAHFADQVRAAGILLLESTTIDELSRWSKCWEVKLTHQDQQPRSLTARFLIDGSGRAGALVRQILDAEKSQVPLKTRDAFLTNSRAIYGHFANLIPWSQVLNELQISTALHPFTCDQAAVHQLIEAGWMWQLPFDNGITSVGFVLHRPAYEHLENLPAAEQFQSLLAEYPSLAQQFAPARLVAPATGLQVTQRMQFMRDRMAGSNWACLPATAGFVDPLHSTGIAHTVHAVRELALIFERHELESVELASELDRYSTRIADELTLIDQLVYACYATLEDFDAFVAATMLYFTAVTFSEQTALQQTAVQIPPELSTDGFLNAGQVQFRQRINQALIEIEHCQTGRQQWKNLPAIVKALIEPFNLVGLCDASLNNIYPHTAPIHLKTPPIE
jgi:FADH2 O2-dependent halogenase